MVRFQPSVIFATQHLLAPLKGNEIVPAKQESQTSEKISSKASRLAPLDGLRGLIMVLMAVDHANLFIAQQHSSGEYWGGRFPVYHDSLAFLTRLITHLAAPGFFFLMGAGMVLFAHARRQSGWSRWAIVRHFLIRGGLLMALQLLVVNRAWELSPGGWGLDIYIGVLFALGSTMIVSSALVWLKPGYLLALTAVLVLGTELLTPDPSQWDQAFQLFNRLLLVPGGNRELWVNYPVLPWLGLATFGIVFGRWLVDDSRRAFGRALVLGGAFLLAFLVLRTLDGFGNIRPRPGSTWIDFFNVVKYPPSITFSLLTMGVNLIIMGLFARVSEEWQGYFRPLVVFGRAPLFFYLTHLFLYAGLGLLLVPGGTSIPQMYPYWLLGLLIVYPLCLGYWGLKHRQPATSILRFF
jgi:uncharacterized membrane protein